MVHGVFSQLLLLLLLLEILDGVYIDAQMTVLIGLACLRPYSPCLWIRHGAKPTKGLKRYRG